MTTPGPDFVPAAERIAVFDRTSIVGALDRGLNESRVRGWTVASIAKDWSRVFPSR